MLAVARVETVSSEDFAEALVLYLQDRPAYNHKETGKNKGEFDVKHPMNSFKSFIGRRKMELFYAENPGLEDVVEAIKKTKKSIITASKAANFERVAELTERLSDLEGQETALTVVQKHDSSEIVRRLSAGELEVHPEKLDDFAVSIKKLINYQESVSSKDGEKAYEILAADFLESHPSMSIEDFYEDATDIRSILGI